MQKRVPSHPERRPRGIARTLTVALLAFVLPSASLAQTPTVDSLNIVPTSSFEAAVSANVVSVGGSPLSSRGFVYSVTSANADPVFGGFPSVNTVSQGGSTGAFSATLGSLVPGWNYSVRAYAQNGEGAGHTPVQTFTAPCPARIFPNLPGASVGTSYFSYVQALGSFGWDVYSLVGSLPPGLFLDSWGYIYGTPSAAGIFNFTVQVVDQYYGCVGSRAYTLEVDALHVVPRKVAFASQLVDAASQPSERKTVTIVNNGPGDVNLSLPLTASAPFAVFSSTCINPLPSTQSCDVVLTYTPPSAAAHNGTMSIGHDQAGGPILVSMRGAGTVSAVQQVYSSNQGSDSVTVIDPVTNAVRAVVGVGNGPSGIAVLPGGAKVYVPNQYENTVSVITTAPTHSVTATIVDANFSSPMAAAATRGGDAVWIVSRDSDAITIIETGTDTVLDTLFHPCVDVPRGVAANPANHEMYVMSDGTSSICVFDRVSRTFLRAIYVGGSPESAVVLPNGSALYMITGNNQSALRVALPSGSITTIPGVYGHSLDITADGSRVFVGREGDGLALIDTSDNSVTSIPLTGNPAAYGVAIHDAAGRIFVSDESRVFVLDLASNTEIPSPELPIEDPSFQSGRVLATAKALPPPGGVPSVGNLANGTPGFVATQVSAEVTSDGGLPIFGRGFAYSVSDETPGPGEADVFTVPVAGGVGVMNANLTGLTSGVTYYYRAYANNIAGRGFSAVGSFMLQTCPVIQVDTASLPNGREGAPYSASLLASGGSGSFTFSYQGLPPGLSGVGAAITGTPTQGAAAVIEVRATEAPTGCFATASYAVTIGSNVAPGALVISEFRTRGAGVDGATDEYVELGNRLSRDVVVLAEDGSGGWSIGGPGGRLALIPDGTVVAKGGHWLATGSNFSLTGYGLPESVGYGDVLLEADIPDDTGLALFTTANPVAYDALTRLDSVGGAAETNALFYEGGKLAALGSKDPLNQTAWVRRIANNAILADSDDNDRDFTFVATDAGNYGPSAEVAAVLGGPNPESGSSVRDVLNSRLPVSLLDPLRGEHQRPNRDRNIFGTRIDYRRVFTNNTGADIGTLAFKVINLTTTNSRQTLPVQGDVRVQSSSGVEVYLEDKDEWVYPTGAQLEFEHIYPLWDSGTVGGLNSTLVVPLGGVSSPGIQQSRQFGECSALLRQGESVSVNFRLRANSGGYFLFVLLPQISEQTRPILTENLQEGGTLGLCDPKSEARSR